ncbi:hypothetical protein IG631_22081 [Alternaria alternata]|nr:hypothetical protein IG631_22081 [Alternaria alternata]
MGCSQLLEGLGQGGVGRLYVVLLRPMMYNASSRAHSTAHQMWRTE